MLLDDCAYSINGETLNEIISTQKDAYLHSNGRVVSHFLVQLFDGIIGKGLFNIVNAIAVCCLIFLLTEVAQSGETKRHSLFLLIVALTLVWFFYPDQYVTMFMVAGSSNYIWATVLTLSALIGFRNMSERCTGIAYLLFCLLCFLAGSWVEMYAVCVAPVLVIWLFSKDHRTVRNAVPVLCYALGAAFVILAPGNFARMDSVGLSSSPFSVNYLARTYSILLVAVKSMLGILWLVIIALSCFLHFSKRQSFAGVIKENGYVFLMTLFSFGFIVVSYAFWPRTFFAIYTFSFIILLRLVSHLKCNRTVLALISFGLCAIVSMDFCREVSVLSAKKDMIAELVDSQRNNPEKIKVLPEWPSSRKSVAANFVSMYSDDWRMFSISEYYHLQPFGVIPAEVSKAISSAMQVNDYVLTPNYLVERIDMSGNKPSNVTVTFDFEGKYVMHPKVSLLLDAIGFSKFSSRIFDECDLDNKLYGQFLVPATETSTVSFVKNENMDNIVIDDGIGRRYSIISRRSLSGNLEIKKLIYR